MNKDNDNPPEDVDYTIHEDPQITADRLRRHQAATELGYEGELLDAYLKGCETEAVITIREQQMMTAVGMHRQCQIKKCLKKARNAMVICQFKAGTVDNPPRSDVKVAFLCNTDTKRLAREYALAGEADGQDVNVEKIPEGEN